MKKIANYEIKEEENILVKALFEFYLGVEVGDRKIYEEENGKIKMLLFPPKFNDMMLGKDGFIYEFFNDTWWKMDQTWDKSFLEKCKTSGYTI